jgi:hypothetical protein
MEPGRGKIADWMHECITPVSQLGTSRRDSFAIALGSSGRSSD